MWFLILVVAVVVVLVAVGIRGDLRRRRRARLLGDADHRQGIDFRPDKVDLDVRSYVKLRETRDAPRNGGMF
jgi:hypothetical protein